MKLYLVAPVVPANADEEALKARHLICAETIAALILPHLTEDPAIFGMWHEGESAKPTFLPDASYGPACVVNLSTPDSIRDALTEVGDPYSGHWMLIRSLLTCRTVAYGPDGQAFVCLPESEPPITSPDANLVVVEECSHLLSRTDWVDGLLLD
jgi:hypothetical protein